MDAVTFRIRCHTLQESRYRIECFEHGGDQMVDMVKIENSMKDIY